MHLPIDQIKVVDRARRDLGDVQALANSIKELGLLQPPVVTQEQCFGGRGAEVGSV